MHASPERKALLLAVTIMTVTVSLPGETLHTVDGAAAATGSTDTTADELLENVSDVQQTNLDLASTLDRTFSDATMTDTEKTLHVGQAAVDDRQDLLSANDPDDIRLPLLTTQTLNLGLAGNLTLVQETPDPGQDIALDVTRQALDHRQLLADTNPTTVGLPSLVEDQRAKANATQELRDVLEREHDSDVAQAIALAQLATRHQAGRLGLDWQAATLPSHAAPSQAIDQLLDRHDVEVTPEQQRRIDALDELPEQLRSSLTDVVDAFIALEAATEDAYAEANLTRAEAWRDANPNEALSEIEKESQRFADEVLQIGRALSSGELSPADAQQAHASLQQTLADGVPDHEAAQVLQDAGIDLAPVLPARNALLEATLDLHKASLSTSQADAANVSVPPVLSIDLTSEDSTYEEDVALQIDVAGNDTYLNNAGGSNLEDGTCSLKDPAAAALMDLDGADEYLGTRGCGAAGGGYLGTGFLFDALGEDRYAPDGGWAPIREGQIDTRLQDIPDGDAAAQADEDRYTVGFHQDPDLSSGDSYEGAEVLTVLPKLSAVSVDASGVDGFASVARDDPDVRYVETDGIVEMAGEFTPDDPHFEEQYGLEQIQAPSAWETTTGGDAKDICVVDTGVDFTHPDLNGTRWKGGVSTQMASDGPRDDNGHGTHVTGIAAATIDNGEGVAGVGNVGFLAAKGLSSIGFGFNSEIAAAITWCADEGADVISMSLGTDSSSSVISDALDHAWEQGALLVAAAGNQGCYGCVQFPGSHEHVIAVPCTDANRSRCDFSNYGPETEIAAPGHEILSTLPECGGDPALCDDSGYGTLNGTSMSTPYVSGAATLVWNAVPELTNAQMRQLLRDTAVDHVLGEGFDEPGCRPEIGYGVVDVDALLQAALDGDRPELEAKIPCTLFPGSWGTNGGGAVAGTGLLVDAGGDDTFLGKDFGTNGGGYMNGVGLLVSLHGNDTFQGGNDGTNGGATTATGALVTAAGEDTYRGGTFGTNGGGAWARWAADQLSSAKDGLQQGSGFLFDAIGNDTYEVDAGGGNGGGYSFSTGFLFDGAGDDTYLARTASVNGGGQLAGVGTLVDGTGDDRYVTTSLQALGANGGGYRAGAGILVDAAGSNAFEAGWTGANGGTWLGSSFLYAGGIGNDTFEACGRGTMGGGFAAAGFLFNAGGDNTYTDYRRCGLLRWTEEGPSNGGGYSIGAGFLMDLGGNDHYKGGEATNGGTDLWGVGMLLDGLGDDLYRGEIKGVNGGAWGLGQAFLVDAGIGDDTFLAQGWGANGGAGGVLGGVDLPMTTHGFLANQGGDDTYGDDEVPITKPSTDTSASSGSGVLGLTGAGLASDEARSFVVGFEQLDSGIEVGDEVGGGTVDRVLPELDAVVVTSTDPLAFHAAVDDLPDVSYVQEDETVEWTQATRNDPWKHWQIGLENTRLPEAWDITFGDPGVKLCLVDTGLYEDHEDIGNVLDGANLYEGGTDTTDGFGHGTHVAGVAAALSNNGVGITGTSEASLLVAKVTDDDGVGTFSSAAEGIRWCADQGADIINLSIGGDHHPLMQEAVTYAWEQGSLLVAAGGNSGGAVDYPAAYPEALAVGCSDVNDNRCSFSPMGRELDVTAPGIDIFGTVPPCEGGVNFCHFTGYAYATGTSASTAFVSGIAALVESVNPDVSNCQLKQLIRETANGPDPEGHDPRYGYGVPDAKAAMDRAQAGDLPEVCPERGPRVDLGANGGGFNHGRGFLYEGAGDDTYKAGGNGDNGGGVDAGVGFLHDALGNDTYTAGSRGANGGGLGGAGLLFDAEGHDRYTAGSNGTNGGADTGAGLLVDPDGCDDYQDANETSTGRDMRVVPKGVVGAQADTSACPIADGTTDRTQTDRITAVHFGDSSTDKDGTIVEWRWDFGDGTTSSEEAPSHTYDELGTFDVTLTVTDDRGETDTTGIATITVVNLAPDMRELDDVTAYEGEETEFRVHAEDPEDDALTYGAENLPAGAEFDEKRRVFSWTPNWTQNGTYENVTFTVTDDYGAQDEQRIDITVLHQPATVKPDLSWSPDRPTSQSMVKFKDETDDHDDRVTSYHWSFGDGTTSTEQEPKHKYGEPGHYNVTLTVTVDDDETISITKSLFARNVEPDADFDWEPKPPRPGEQVDFTDLSSDTDGEVVDWRWRFEDGTTSSEQHPSHTFEEGGYHTVTLTVTDDWGDETTVSKEVGVCDDGSLDTEATAACADPEG